MKKINQLSLINDRNLSVLVFALFFSWLLAFPFEGQVLYALLAKYDHPSTLIFHSIIAHLVGLISPAFYLKSMKAARHLIAASIIVCILGTAVFIFEPSAAWTLGLIISSYAAGSSVSAWGYFFKELTWGDERIKIAADGLIFSNILMIVINVVTVYVSAYAGLILSMMMLGLGFIFALKLPSYSKTNKVSESNNSKNYNIVKPMMLLCVFIIITTINSGLMYQAINPDFSHFEELVSWYWALPYIAAIFFMRNSSNSRRTYMLYVAIAMIGLAFISYLVLNRSVVSYFVIDTLMLGAFGIFDLFWWSILGEMLDYTASPARILGIGLSSNVSGVLVGGLVGSYIYKTYNSKLNSSLLALVVVFIVLIILPVLQSQLNKLLKYHSYKTSVKLKEHKDELLNINQLTERENQIAKLLLSGRTYKMIAEELYLSENTVKTHIKNIYSKLNIQSKTELIKLICDSSKIS